MPKKHVFLIWLLESPRIAPLFTLMATKITKTGGKPNQYVVRRGAVPPAVYLLHVNDKQWEEFIAAACRLRDFNPGKYAQVKILGNAGDKGRDVEARLESALIADRWDLYQAKHYEKRLTPGTAYPELVKFFGHLLNKSYVVPRKYYFCAPKNAGPELHDLLANSDLLREGLLAAWRNGTHGLQSDVAKLTPTMEAYIRAFDFSRFEECLVHDLLAWHEKDVKAHYQLFGIEPERGDDPAAPSTTESMQMLYVEELIRVYAEHCSSPLQLDGVLADESYREHLDAARQTFYAAEGLKRFSRDLYTEDEFSNLLEMVLTGINPVVKSIRLRNGLDRCEETVKVASTLKVTDSVLYKRLRGGDLPGTCHHLVNEKRIKWVR